MITEVAGYKPIDSVDYQYRAYCWDTDDARYLLVTAMVAYQSFWGIPVDLGPSEALFDDFMDSTVLPNLKHHPIGPE